MLAERKWLAAAVAMGGPVKGDPVPRMSWVAR